MPKYSYSTDGEVYHGEFDSIDEALADLRGSSLRRPSIYIGENRAPIQPELLWDAEDWLEHVSVQDDYSMECAEEWDGSTKGQRDELEAEVRKVMAAWLDRHGLRPRHFVVDDPIEYRWDGALGRYTSISQSRAEKTP